jgi:diacylglycerol kinase (ATP)
MADVVQIVTNPDAGNYRPRKIEALRSAFARQGARVTLAYIGPGKQLIIEGDATLLCVAGGDGTIRHVVATMRETGRNIALTAYPFGTINLFQRETGVPQDPEIFAKHVLGKTKAEAHFPVAINRSLFLGCASVGPDAIAVANLSPRLKKSIGRMAYGVALMRQIMKWPRPQLTMIVDGKRHACEAVYVAKGMYFAGPWSFAPQAKRTNAKLHVVALKKASRRHFIRFMINVVRGRPLHARDNLICLTSTALSVESDLPWAVQADGDDVGTLPLHIALIHDPIRVH